MTERSSHQIVVSVGSNCQAEAHLTQGFDALQCYFGGLRLSSVYKSSPVDSRTQDPIKSGGADYLNAVAVFVSDKTVAEVQEILRLIEHQCGRDRSQREVAIDIDLLLYDEVVGLTEGVYLPREDILHCAYVLRPLAEVLPDMMHPVEGRSFYHLWQEFPEKQVLESVDFVWQEQVISVVTPCFVI